jgi:hypothetical protein
MNFHSRKSNAKSFLCFVCFLFDVPFYTFPHPILYPYPPPPSYPSSSSIELSFCSRSRGYIRAGRGTVNGEQGRPVTVATAHVSTQQSPLAQFHSPPFSFPLPLPRSVSLCFFCFMIRFRIPPTRFCLRFSAVDSGAGAGTTNTTFSLRSSNVFLFLWID